MSLFKRKNPRIPFDAPVTLLGGGLPETSRLKQISLGGAFLATGFPANQDNVRLHLKVFWPDGKATSVDAEPRYWVKAGHFRLEPTLAGCGLRFLGPNAEFTNRVTAVVQRTLKLYRDIQFNLALTRPMTNVDQLIREAGLPLDDRKAVRDWVSLVLDSARAGS